MSNNSILWKCWVTNNEIHEWYLLQKIGKISTQSKTQIENVEMHKRKNLNLFPFSHQSTSHSPGRDLKVQPSTNWDLESLSTSYISQLTNSSQVRLRTHITLLRLLCPFYLEISQIELSVQKSRVDSDVEDLTVVNSATNHACKIK